MYAVKYASRSGIESDCAWPTIESKITDNIKNTFFMFLLNLLNLYQHVN